MMCGDVVHLQLLAPLQPTQKFIAPGKNDILEFLMQTPFFFFSYFFLRKDISKIDDISKNSELQMKLLL